MRGDGLDEPPLGTLLAEAAAALDAGRAQRSGPLPAGGPAVVAKLVTAVLDGSALPHKGIGAVQALRELGPPAAHAAADPVHPLCAGHLHCPPLPVAVATEALIAALNQSLDSWDQAPAATELERHVITELAELIGFSTSRPDGVVTSGGTESNLMGLLLARDHNAGTGPLRVVHSELAHFSVARSAALLGIDGDALLPVPADRFGRLDIAAAERVLAAQARAVRPVVVATAGTTDLGSIDSLPEIALLARRFGAWMHVDAAYGGGALFSSRLAPLLDGLAEADSVALDLHKLGWQPVPAGVFIVKDGRSLAPLARTVSYLNPADDEAAGFPSLLGKSLRTTRRADVLKLAVSFRAYGREGLGAMVDRCYHLARYAAQRIDEHPALRLYQPPVLTSVVFSFNASTGNAALSAGDDDSAVNAALRRQLLASGRAVIGRTDLFGETWLKLTLLNPSASRTDIDELLDAVVAAGKDVAS